MTPNLIPQPTVQSSTEDDIDLFGFLDILIDAKWLVSGITAAAIFLGAGIAFLSRPVYEANTLIQVEESKPGAGSALGDAASLFEIRSPATAEMELLRSRLVVGQAVDELLLHVTAEPKRPPIIGNWLSSKATTLSAPTFLGMKGYVTGSEEIKISVLDVPEIFEGKDLTVLVTESGYKLFDYDDNLIVEGKVGEVVPFNSSVFSGRIAIHTLRGNPGAEFIVNSTSRLAVIEDLQKDLSISEKGKQSGVISIRLQGNDPDLIAKTLAAVGGNYVRQNVERKAAEADKTLNFLNTFLPELKKQLELSEVKFNQFRNQNGTFDLSTEGQIALKNSVELQTNLLDLQQKKRELSIQFTSSHPNVRVIDSQIDALNKQIISINNRIKGLPNVEQDLLRLTRDVKVNSELYLNLLNSAQQLRLVRAGTVGNVRVVDPAVTQEKPVAPKKAQILIISTFLGVIAGFMAAFLRSRMHPGIKDASDIEQITGLSVFATIPHSEQQSQLYEKINSKVHGQHLLAIIKSDDPGVESLRSLRTALQFALLDARNNIVLFSGPTPGIGKSFISANFAAVLASGGKRVLLIDADIRKGYLNQYFGFQRGPGLTDLIAGNLSFEQVVHRNAISQLDVLTTGQLPPNPGELLMSPSMSHFLTSVSDKYDLVLIDTPPVLAVSDTQVVALSAGTVFLVAKANVTAIGELQESVKRLSQAGTLVKGVVFNDYIVNSRRYGGYGYSYGYRYGRYKYKNYQYGQN